MGGRFQVVDLTTNEWTRCSVVAEPQPGERGDFVQKARSAQIKTTLSDIPEYFMAASLQYKVYTLGALYSGRICLLGVLL